ncbi:uncharacterized protein LOC106160753 isoform X2 [Lingula anatina]|uniref:Uncharacterized protein LOC106160753 isoform X2 n=1 Tax=Lingula anatina TaxID=7574 RepID=A0A1S3I3R5_LINAN|nr:uncharacterized protein LOC106160753 isoform X2 [Lingula anatina]|eukprot:XP_013392878.1 uncharacterized protein LOC106160753 isoform X2 [Lingula anatina]
MKNIEKITEMKMNLTACVLFISLFSIVSLSVNERRLSVIEDRLTTSNILLAFATDTNGALECAEGQRSSDYSWKWGNWLNLGSPSGVKFISNPAASYTPSNATAVYLLGSNGKLHFTVQNLGEVGGCRAFSPSYKIVSTNVSPSTTETLTGMDSVSVVKGKKDSLYNVFYRTPSNRSELYVSETRDGINFSNWTNLGGDLLSDATVIFNTFSGYLECYASFKDGKLYRTWQYEGTDWAKWRVHGDGQPDVISTTRPVAHLMSQTVFNGMVEVFALGTDGLVHHIWQTTCDKVKNPWGYCTWGVWEKIHSKVPSLGTQVNALAISNNIHLGNEVFLLDSYSRLWHLWQLEISGKWNGWDLVGSSSAGKMASLPLIIVSVTQNHSIYVNQSAMVNFGKNWTAVWTVPVDEATNKDWIGVFPSATSDDSYVDFRYVQGTQNPRKDPVPVGKVTFRSFLPDGVYDVRYMVNRKYISVMQTSMQTHNMTHDKEWVQLYNGLEVGLGKEGANLSACVQDGNATVQTFKLAFDAFENREIIKGLQLFGKALKDVQVTLVQCEETTIAERLGKFIKDLVECTEGSCTKFVIDIAEEILVVYEDIYEIFGDIKAANNALGLLKAYQQSGLCIGRVVGACISLPS